MHEYRQIRCMRGLLTNEFHTRRRGGYLYPRLSATWILFLRFPKLDSNQNRSLVHWKPYHLAHHLAYRHGLAWV